MWIPGTAVRRLFDRDSAWLAELDLVLAVVGDVWTTVLNAAAVWSTTELGWWESPLFDTAEAAVMGALLAVCHRLARDLAEGELRS